MVPEMLLALIAVTLGSAAFTAGGIMLHLAKALNEETSQNLAPDATPDPSRAALETLRARGYLGCSDYSWPRRCLSEKAANPCAPCLALAALEASDGS